MKKSIFDNELYVMLVSREAQVSRNLLHHQKVSNKVNTEKKMPASYHFVVFLFWITIFFSSRLNVEVLTDSTDSAIAQNNSDENLQESLDDAANATINGTALANGTNVKEKDLREYKCSFVNNDLYRVFGCCNFALRLRPF